MLTMRFILLLLLWVNLCGLFTQHASSTFLSGSLKV